MPSATGSASACLSRQQTQQYQRYYKRLNLLHSAHDAAAKLATIPQSTPPTSSSTRKHGSRSYRIGCPLLRVMALTHNLMVRTLVEFFYANFPTPFIPPK